MQGPKFKSCNWSNKWGEGGKVERNREMEKEKDMMLW